MRQGPEFIAASGLNSCAANAVTGLFVMMYAGLVRRVSPWRSLGIAATGWLLISLAAEQLAWTVGAVIAFNVMVYGVGLLLMNRDHVAEPGSTRPSRRPWFDLPSRAAFVAAFVTLVVTAGDAMGPAATGIAAVFPVSLISLLAMQVPRLGGPATARVAIGALPPMAGFGAMLLALHLAIPPYGVPAALGLALGVSLVWSLVLVLIQVQRRGRVVSSQDVVAVMLTDNTDNKVRWVAVSDSWSWREADIDARRRSGFGPSSPLTSSQGRIGLRVLVG
jgi:hypothetical protein